MPDNTGLIGQVKNPTFTPVWRTHSFFEGDGGLARLYAWAAEIRYDHRSSKPYSGFVLRRSTTSQVLDAQVGTPSRGSTQRTRIM